MSGISQLLDQTYEAVKEYGADNNYAVFNVFSEFNAEMITPKMKESKDRLEVRMYGELNDPILVGQIQRYQDGVLVETVKTTYVPRNVPNVNPIEIYT